MEQQTLCEIFVLIAEYAEQHGWMPIGFRTFDVGPWRITVNGTDHRAQNIEPYHALIEHQKIVSYLMLSPFGGSVAGWHGSEDALIADLRAALAPPATPHGAPR